MIKNVIVPTSQFLNQPLVKENIKNVTDRMSFAFAIFGLYNIGQILLGHRVSSEAAPSGLEKMAVVSGKISVLLSGLNSQISVKLFSKLASYVTTPAQLERLFSAVNPRHPRHVLSIAALVFAAPSITLSTYKTVNWAYRVIRPSTKKTKSVNSSVFGLTDAKVRAMVLFNTLFSRVTLHNANQFIAKMV